MEGEKYRNLKRNPEAQDYRRYAAAALRSARQYDGSERAFDELFRVLIDLEECIRTTTSLQESQSQHREIEAAYRFAPKHPREIYDLLTVATESWERRLHRAVEHPDEDHGIVVNQVDGVLLPPGTMERQSGSRTGGFEARFEPRIDEVMKILKTLRVFSDDVIVTMGEIGKNQMREVSYAVIDIPRLDRMILVCNQVGEATFVLSERIPVTDLLCVTKSDLPREFPGTVTRIIRNANWEKEILTALGDTPTKEKMDVRALDREQLRAAILEKYPTSEDWVRAFRNERQGAREGASIEVLGRKLHFIGKRFGMNGTHITIAEFVALSREIYGEQDVYLKVEARRLENGVEEWTRRIREKYPTFSEWFTAYREGAGKEGGRNIVVDGRKLGFFGTLFGLEERPYGLSAFLKLSAMIYGAEDPDLLLTAQQNREWSLEEWKEGVLLTYPTAEDFFQEFRGDRSEGRDIHVQGKGIQFLAGRFGIPISRSRITMAILLAEQVYGSENPVVQREKLRNEKRPKEEWKALILERYPTSADWMAAYRGADGRNQGKDIEICGRRAAYLASQFGVETGHTLSLEGCIALGQKVYGENDAYLHGELLRIQGDQELWKAAILEKYPTSKEWIERFRGTRRFDIDVFGKGINAIAARFGFPGTVNLKEFLDIGALIYGADDPMIRAERDRAQDKTPEEWIRLIRTQFSTAEQFIEEFKRNRQGRGIVVAGRGLVYFAKQCGIDGDPRLIENLLALSAKIYGDDDPYIRQEAIRVRRRKGQE